MQEALGIQFLKLVKGLSFKSRDKLPRCIKRLSTTAVHCVIHKDQVQDACRPSALSGLTTTISLTDSRAPAL
eukprot:scaffold3108_cov102-Skeletonema_dohrnii-CCMP3373.AAC.8